MWGGWSLSSFQCNRVVNFAKVAAPIVMCEATEEWAFSIVSMMSGMLTPVDVGAFALWDSIVMTLWGFHIGLGSAVVIRVGTSAGEGNISKIKRIIFTAILTALSVSMVVTVILLTIPEHIARLFTKDPQVVHIVVTCLPVMCVTFFFGSVAAVLSFALEGASRNVGRSMVSGGTAWFVYLPLCVYFGFYSNMGSPIFNITCVTATMAFSRACLLLVLVCRTDWKKVIAEAQKRSEKTDITITCSNDDNRVTVVKLQKNNYVGIREEGDDKERLISANDVANVEAENVRLNAISISASSG